MDKCEKSKEIVLSALRTEMTRETAPSVNFSNSVMVQLQQAPLETRQFILNSSLGDWSPLSHACRSGLTEMVIFLCQCGADPDQKGYYPVGEAVHFATPLWYAAVAGNLDVAKVLVEYGADVNVASDTGMTVIHAACSQTRIPVVKYLLENVADIVRPNMRGETCLMNSVQSQPLCELLLEDGLVDVNAQNCNGMTALHCAIEGDNCETAQLLVQMGADPCLQNSSGDDALRLASSKGMIQICNYLFGQMNLTPEIVADSHELLGAAYSDINIAGTIQLWKISALIRDNSNICKHVLPPIGALGHVVEFSSTSELDSLNSEPSSIKLQSLLICQRILGLTHQVSMFRLLSCKVSFVQSRRYQETIQLLLFCLELTAASKLFVFSEIHSIITELVKVFHEVFELFPIVELQRMITFESAHKILTLIGDQIDPLLKLVSVKPVFLEHEYIFNNMLKVLIMVLHMVLLMSPTLEQKQHLVSYVRKIVLLNPVNTDGDQLLHLALTTDNFCSCRSRELNPEEDSLLFSNYGVVQVLLECNAPVHAFSSKGLPPLYCAAFKRCYTKEMFELLLSYGAHPDQVNASGETPLDVLFWHAGGGDFIHLLTTPLKCLAARALRRSGRTFGPGELPSLLESFVAMH